MTEAGLLAGMVEPSRRYVSERAFFGVLALLFAASASLTIVWCASMSSLGMPMPGGWTMSMVWMRMPGQTWPAAAASFLGMWIVMMVAMMLPSLVPMLRRYRQAVCMASETRLDWLTSIAGAGYFFVWTIVGIAVFPLGVALAAIEMRQPALARAVPIGIGVVVLIAGALSSARGKRITWPAVGKPLAAAVRSRRTPARPGDTDCAWVSTAATAVPT